MQVNNQVSVKVDKKTIAVERLVAAALSYVGFKEAGDNRGQVVERFLKGTGLPGGYAWCCAFVYHVGYWSQYDEVTKKSRWPLIATAGCKELGQDAAKKKMLVSIPKRGDVFLKYFPSKGRFAHTGVILSYKQIPGERYNCITVKGNTNTNGSAEGDSVLLRSRIITPQLGDRFIRWTEVL